jgi:hypothetical protein
LPDTPILAATMVNRHARSLFRLASRLDIEIVSPVPDSFGKVDKTPVFMAYQAI